MTDKEDKEHEYNELMDAVDIVANLVSGYYNALLDRGISDASAVELTKSYQTAILAIAYGKHND